MLTQESSRVLCAHTRYTLRREECCVWIECFVHTQGTHIGGKSVVCGLSVVCTHKGREECCVHTQREGRVLCAHTTGGKSVVCTNKGREEC